MRRKLFRALIGLAVIQLIGFAVGTIISKRLTRGDETSDDFRVAAVFGGKKFHSTADHLKSGSAIASVGGVDLDLRDATLDEDGATLELRATMGGVQALVPENWAVDVNADSVAGDVEIWTTPIDTLPDDAPKLHIDAVSRLGGVMVTTKAGEAKD